VLLQKLELELRAALLADPGVDFMKPFRPNLKSVAYKFCYILFYWFLKARIVSIDVLIILYPDISLR
jgi:hypothetical protein